MPPVPGRPIILPDIKPKQLGSPRDYFFPVELMAVKKWARDKFDLLRADGFSKKEARTLAVAAIHKMLPGFKQSWESRNKCRLDDKWLEQRIDHQSDDMDKKISHLRLKDFLDFLAHTQFEDRVYDWNEWTRLVNENLVNVKVLKMSYVYLLPMRHPDSSEYHIQKVGFATNLKWRLSHYHMSARINGGILGGQKRHCFGLIPAEDFEFTYPLGKLQDYESIAIEYQCHKAVGNGRPAAFGREWFKIGTKEAVRILKKVLEEVK